MARHKACQPRLYVASNRHDRAYSVEELREAWKQYKRKQDDNVKIECAKRIVTDDNGEKHTEVEEREVLQPLTYTQEGFLRFLPLSSSTWCAYKQDEDYADVMADIENDIKANVRERFEDRSLDTRLAALWMSRYPEYRTRQETEIKGGVPVVISGEDKLED